MKTNYAKEKNVFTIDGFKYSVAPKAAADGSRVVVKVDIKTNTIVEARIVKPMQTQGAFGKPYNAATIKHFIKNNKDWFDTQKVLEGSQSGSKL